MLLPSHYGITQHKEWRKGQHEAVEWMLSSQRKRTMVVQAPIGSGKSATGTALGANGRTVRTLTATRALQKQYSDGYEYEELFGMNAYPCALYGQGLGFGDGLSAEHCIYPTDMYKCRVVHKCEYLSRKKATQDSNRQALSYAYFFTSKWAKQSADYLYADECHNIPSLLMNHYTLEIDQYVAQTALGISKWADQLKSMSKWIAGKSLVVQFLTTGVSELDDQLKQFPEGSKLTPSLAMHVSTLKSWRENMARIQKGMANGYPYYIKLVPYDERGDKADRGDLLIIAPLSARDFFIPTFLEGHSDGDPLGRIVLTSATVGDPEIFGSLIGLDRDQFDFHSVPSRFKSSEMPVYVPVDAPYIKYTSSEKELDKQAEVIKRLIDSVGKKATGLVHFSSKRATYDMADRLARIGLQDRIYVTPEDGGTEDRVARFKAYQDCNPGTVHLTWCMWEGYDGFDDQFSIVAKAPYPQENDLVAMQRKFDGGNYYRWSTAIAIEQGVGRVRRGDESHYGPDADKLTAIVDRNALKLKQYYTDNFQQCLVEDA